MLAPVPTLIRKAVDEALIQAIATRTDLRLRRSAGGSGRFLVGPWLSEVGFEVLYWIPLLRWLSERAELAPGDVTVVSRGGAGAWYRDIAGEALDVFSWFDPQEVKQRQEQRVAQTRSQKQFAAGEFDRAVLERAYEHTGSDVTVLHPELMYNLLRAFWAQRRPMTFVEQRARYERLPSPALSAEAAAAVAALPARFVAVKLYFSSCFPADERNRRFAAALVRSLAARSPVVLLSTGIDLDDHQDVGVDNGQIVTLEHVMRPEDNLAVQTAVIERAHSLYSTYGGFSYLGPFLGVPSFCFHSVRNYNPMHLDVMSRAAGRLQPESAGGFTSMDVADATRLLGLDA